MDIVRTGSAALLATTMLTGAAQAGAQSKQRFSNKVIAFKGVRTRYAAALIVSATALAFASPQAAQADVVLADSFFDDEADGAKILTNQINGSKGFDWVGQTFIAPRSGQLTSIELWISRDADFTPGPGVTLPDVDLYLTETNADSTPTLLDTPVSPLDVIAQDTVNPSEVAFGDSDTSRVDFDLSSAIQIDDGEEYAIIARVDDSVPWYQWNAVLGEIPGHGLERTRDTNDDPIWDVADGQFERDRGILVKYEPDNDPPDLSGVPDGVIDYTDFGGTVTLDASAATDDFSITNYDWKLVTGFTSRQDLTDGTAAQQPIAVTQLVGDGFGQISDPTQDATLLLTATDSDGVENEKLVTYTYDNQAPSAVYSGSEVDSNGAFVDFTVEISDDDFAMNSLVSGSFEELRVDVLFDGTEVDDLLDILLTSSSDTSAPFASIAMATLQSELGAGFYNLDLRITDLAGAEFTLFEFAGLSVPEEPVEPPSSDVPAPAAAGLLGAGLVALRRLRRRA